MGKWCLHASSFIFDRIIIKVAGNQDRHKSSDEFDFGPLVSMAHLYVFLKWDLTLAHWTQVSDRCPLGYLFTVFLGVSEFLAHLSRRLTRWAYSIPMVRHPSSSVVVRRRPHFQTWISLKPVGQSWSNFMCSITGVGERLHKVLGQIGSKLWLPWQQKAPIDL